MESGESQPSELIEKFLDLFRRELSEPEYYLDPRESLQSECLAGVKLLFNALKRSGSELPTGPLQQLYTAGFDEDQVWEEVQLTNEPAMRRLCANVEALLGSALQLLATTQTEDEEDIVIGVEETEEESSASEEVMNTQSDGEDTERQGVSKGLQMSGVDDGFFNLSDMERYLEEAELLSDPGSENSVGALAETLSDTGSEQLHYHDFFDPPLVGRHERSCGGEKESAEGDKQQLSSHERRQLKLAGQIRGIEAANVSQKSWQMSGEVSSSGRPLNSLLEEVVDFNPMTAPPPVITEETTHSLEDMIKQRILDQAWDDVQRKVKPPEKPYDYQRAQPLNQEKSKKSLAKIYEEDYVKQTHEACQPNEGAGLKEEKDPKHVEIEEMKTRLFLKLDALSNFHFTPKPPQSELCVVSNVSAVVMEEITPLAAAQDTLLAPEEIQTKPRAPEKGESERTASDRRRLRVAKKWMKRRHNQSQMARLRASAGGVRSGSKGWLGKSGLRSSHHFFASLQQQAKTTKQRPTKAATFNRTGTQLRL